VNHFTIQWEVHVHLNNEEFNALLPRNVKNSNDFNIKKSIGQKHKYINQFVISICPQLMLPDVLGRCFVEGQKMRIRGLDCPRFLKSEGIQKQLNLDYIWNPS